MGVVLMNLGQYDRALEILEQALQRNPLNAEVYLKLGMIHAGRGRHEDAIRMYKKVMEINPHDASVHVGVGGGGVVGLRIEVSRAQSRFQVRPWMPR